MKGLKSLSKPSVSPCVQKAQIDFGKYLTNKNILSFLSVVRIGYCQTSMMELSSENSLSC